MQPIASPDSVARAKAAQKAERDEVFRVTGVRIEDDEPFDSYTIVCPYCLAPCGGENKGKADRAYARHVVNAHRAHLKVGA